MGEGRKIRVKKDEKGLRKQKGNTVQAPEKYQ